MPDSCFTGPTLDDVMRSAIEAILARGDRVISTKGNNIELTGVLLELTNPRARLSRTETRGKPFSCLGELCWYLAKSNDLDFIYYYIKPYAKDANGDEIRGGYGPRLFNWKGLDQLANITALLRKKRSSRQAVIQLFDACDIAEEHKSIPCTCTLQFMIRDGKLNMLTHMRSNDVFVGLPHDVFAFTMLQEIVARTLSVELGTYKHTVGSLHLYEKNKDEAQRFLDEGWQSTEMPMPPMPIGDPWPAIEVLLRAEAIIRAGDPLAIPGLEDLDAYWADLVRLLQVLRFRKLKDAQRIEELRGRMASPSYQSFIEKKLDECRVSSGKRAE